MSRILRILDGTDKSEEEQNVKELLENQKRYLLGQYSENNMIGKQSTFITSDYIREKLEKKKQKVMKKDYERNINKMMKNRNSNIKNLNLQI